MRFENPQCEVCGGSVFKTLGRRLYRRSETGRLDPYNAKRFRVLFEKWFPGREEIELRSVMCGRCGFVFYEPRPEKRDIDEKYRFLEELGQDYGAMAYDAPGEQKRAEVLFAYLAARIDLSRTNEVLDYGGGDGRLMQGFVHRGKRCFNVDYNVNCIPGVKKLGDTLDSLAPERKFDLIVCSHVIEHVADPVAVVRGLSRHLAEDGWLYVEVPMEIWKSAPLQHEPVTHINFFMPNSLRYLLEAAGLKVRESRLTAYLHPSGNYLHGIKSLSHRAGVGETPAPEPHPPEAERWIRPGAGTYLSYVRTNPAVLKYAVQRRLGGRVAAGPVPSG